MPVLSGLPRGQFAVRCSEVLGMAAHFLHNVLFACTIASSQRRGGGEFDFIHLFQQIFLQPKLGFQGYSLGETDQAIKTPMYIPKFGYILLCK